MTPESYRPWVTVVVITRNRIESLRGTLRELSRSSACPVIVVDNASSDGTADMVASEYPRVRLIALSRNRGALARNLGVAASRTELVAFADDDSSWAPGALERAGRIFASSPEVGLLAARILVGTDERLDPTCRVMEESRLGADRHGRARVLGFVACGTVVRRRAFSDCGGFEELLFFMGEEETLALDLASAGWDLVYAPDVVALHRPEKVTRDPVDRRRRRVRNGLISALIHHPWGAVMGRAARLAGAARRDVDARAGLCQGLFHSPRAMLRRRPLPSGVEAARRLLHSP